MKRSDLEIMAPVGCWESLHAAINAGADAVYFGIEKLNMRSHSSANFTTEDLHTIVSICREAGVKTYLTVNTIIYEDDLDLMREIVDNAAEAGVSAIIACDIAVMQYAVSRGVEVHLSVQLNISNADSLRFYAQYADVVVLARELNLDQVAAIHRKIEEEPILGRNGQKVRIEMFCHGALCMAVSGKCYLSLHEMNQSANRGACMQVCRRAYYVHDYESDIDLKVDNKYIMSPKDLRTIHFLNKMVDSGVRVFKIEGRARGPEYVNTVVRCYDEALKAICDGTYNSEMIPAWEERLSRVFNRGFWDGYYLGQRLGEWCDKYGSKASRKKVYVAKCTNYFKKLGVAEFMVESQSINAGDEYLITGETTGALEGTIDDMRVNDATVPTVARGIYFSMKCPLVRRGDRLYKMEIIK